MRNLKLKFNDVKDQILAKKVCRTSEAIPSNFTLNIGTRSRSLERNSNWGYIRSNSKNGRSKFRFLQDFILTDLNYSFW